jgi:hypothetical protein
MNAPRWLIALFTAALGTTVAGAADTVPERCYEYCAEAARAVRVRTGPATGRGTYLLEYLGGPHGRSLTHARATFQTWFTETNARVDLRYEVNHDRFPRTILVRTGNLHLSHRFAPSPELTPMAVVSGIYTPDTRPVLHGLLVDPAMPHLHMFDVGSCPHGQLRFRPAGNGRIEAQVFSAKDPVRVVVVVEFDPHRGYLPCRQRFYRSDSQQNAVTLEMTYDWQRYESRWFCRAYEAIDHGSVTLDGQTFHQRRCRIVFEELKFGDAIDPALFHLDSLELPPGSVVGDLRKDAPEPYFVYKPESDPRQQELDTMVEEAKRLAQLVAVEEDVDWWRSISPWTLVIGVALAAGLLWRRSAVRRISSQRLVEQPGPGGRRAW